MSKILILETEMYAPSTGLVPIRRGDAKSLHCKVLDRIGSQIKSVDMTGRSATAYFEGKDSEVVTKVVAVATGVFGCLEIDLSTTNTAALELNEDGVSFYIKTDQNETIETEGSPLEVKDPGFDTI